MLGFAFAGGAWVCLFVVCGWCVWDLVGVALVGLSCLLVFGFFDCVLGFLF